jgi:hypothetical protein
VSEGAPRRYVLSGTALVSDVPIAAPADGPLVDPTTPPMTIRLATGEAVADAAAIAWEPRDSGPHVARLGDGFLVSAPGFTDFVVDRGGRTIAVHPRPGCALEIVQQLLVDQVLPLALHARGLVVLHASAVAIDGGVAAFVGRTGLGKSTLAASLTEAGVGEHFSDDCLAVAAGPAGPLVYPSYGAARLWPVSAGALFGARGELPLVSPRSSKRRVDLAPSARALPLRRVYLLEPGDGEPVITTLAPTAAIVAMAAQLHRLDVADRALLRVEIERLGAVARAARVARLAYRRSFDELWRVREAIARDAG